MLQTGLDKLKCWGPAGADNEDRRQFERCESHGAFIQKLPVIFVCLLGLKVWLSLMVGFLD